MNNNQYTYNQPPMGQVPMGAMMPPPQPPIQRGMPMRKRMMSGVIKMKDEFLDKCIDFSVKINKLRKYLREEQHEYNNSDQIQRSGTSIGANYSEACDAESKADFIHKLGIAQKEANETIYWLKVLYGSELITKTQYDELLNDVSELYRIITACIKTAKNNQ